MRVGSDVDRERDEGDEGDEGDARGWSACDLSDLRGLINRLGEARHGGRG